MSKLKKILSVFLSLILAITSIITVLPISYAESSTNNDISNDILDIPEDELDIDKNIEDYYENLNELVPGKDYIEGEMIVKYLPTNNSQTLVDIAEDLEMNIEYSLEESNTFDTFDIDDSADDEGLYVLSFDEEKSVTDLVQEVSAFDEVEYAQPNYIYKTCEINAPYTLKQSDATGFDSQQAMLNTLNLSSEPYTGEGVIVAVIDTGIDLSHPALQGCFWNNDGIVGYNTVNPKNFTAITMEDDDIYTGDHGTHVAGIIAMQSNSTYTAKGIAPNVKIMNLQASNEDNEFDTASIVKALELAEANGADIVNMSLGKSSYDHTMYLACNKAARNMVLVAAAGNDGTERTPHYPAAFSSVIGVMSYGGSSFSGDYPNDIAQNIVDATSFLNTNYPTSQTMVLANTSNYDSQMKYYDVVAPGVNICSTKARTDEEKSQTSFSNFRYVFKSGTSMAAPIISGAVALYIEKNPNATPGQIRDAIRNDSGKKVKLFKTVGNNTPITPSDLISNQIDVSHLLSISPNPEIDSVYIHNNNPDYADLCTFIKSQFDNGFAANESITNEDIRLISFLYFTSIDTNWVYLTQLSELTNLLTIIIEGTSQNNINNEDINYIINNNHLERLDLLMIYRTKISSIEIPNSFAPNLNKLTVVQNRNLTEVCDLSTFSNLSYVNLYENYIIDTSFLQNMENIKVLDISYNQITNLKDIAPLLSLEKLYFSGNNIKDISDVVELTKLVTIDFSSNYITNINPVEHLVNLESIDFSNNHVTDISVLAGLTQLNSIIGYNNLINNIGNVLSLKSLSLLYLADNALDQQYDYIENTLKSNEQVAENLLVFDISSNLDIIQAEEVVANDMSFKRTDLYFAPDIRVFPYNATYAHNIELNSNSSAIIVNEYSNTLAYNPRYNYSKTASEFTSTIDYSIDKLQGSFNVSLLMPTIVSASLERYSFVGNAQKNYISIVTSTDTTKIKVCSNSFNDIFYDLSSENVTYEDYGNERIIKILWPQSINIPSNMIVYAGDEIGYLGSKNINSNNTVNIQVEGQKINSIIGTAGKLFVQSEGITAIGTNAIGNSCCINELVLSTEISTIEPNAFNNCGVTNLFIRNVCTSSKENIFFNCNNMTVYVSKSSPIKEFDNAIIISDFRYEGKILFKYLGSESNVTIPPYLKLSKINANAFEGNTDIRSIDLSNITEIGTAAFRGCSNLSEIRGFLNVSGISQYAFSGSAVESISIGANISPSFAQSSFEMCTGLRLVSTKGVSFPYLKENAFKGCLNLKYINIDARNPFKIDESCFEGCSALKTFCFDNVSEIKSNAFKNCNNLGSEVILYATTLESNAFYGCSSIKSVTFMKSSTLGSKAFYDCHSLESVGFILTGNKCASDSFDECSGNLTIYTNGISLINSDNNEAYTSNNVTVCSDFSLNGNQLSNIKLVKYTGNQTHIIIPECLKIYEIGVKAIYYNQQVNKVTIPKSVRIIGNNAFAMSFNLEEILGGLNVLYIEERAFYNCKKLHIIECFDSVVSFGMLSCAYTAIDSIDFPVTLARCAQAAFAGCRQLKTVEFNGVINTLSKELFWRCSSLERCVLTPRIKTIGGDVFAQCDNLKQIYIPCYVQHVYSSSFPATTVLFCEEGVAFLSNLPYGFSNQIYPNYKVENGVLLDYQSDIGYDYIDSNEKRVIDVPNAIEQISSWTFFNNKNVDKVILSNYLDIIDEYAFIDCSVNEIVMPETMSSIGRSALNRTRITSIDIPEGITKIEDYFMHSTPVQHVIIPDSVTEIGNSAFASCNKLNSVYIPDSVTLIDSRAFENSKYPITLWGKNNSYLNQYVSDNSRHDNNNILICRLGFNIAENRLISYTGDDVNVQIPFGIDLNNIADAVFKNNTTVESISIASGITDIGAECFSGCTSLTTLVVPDDVVSVGTNAFYGTPNLTVYCNEGSFIEGYCIENNINVNTHYDIADGVLKAYTGSETNLTIPSNLCITTIGTEAFYGNSDLLSVNIPEGVFKVDSMAFDSCTKLQTISLPSTNCVEISKFAFSDCNDLINIVNSTSIVKVDSWAFSSCDELETIDLSNVEIISSYAFDYCDNLTDVILGTSLISMGNNVFMGSENIRINCYSDSVAHQYAVANDIPYLLLDEVTMSTFSMKPHTPANITPVNVVNDNIDSRINNTDDELYSYIQQEYGNEITENDIDDIAIYMINAGLL